MRPPGENRRRPETLVNPARALGSKTRTCGIFGRVIFEGIAGFHYISRSRRLAGDDKRIRADVGRDVIADSDRPGIDRRFRIAFEKMTEIVFDAGPIGPTRQAIKQLVKGQLPAESRRSRTLRNRHVTR
jgi:hypothetical protein